MKKRTSEKLGFSLAQFAFWCSWSAFTPFAALLFQKLGLGQAEIGFALSLSTLGGILGQFVWGFLCDRLHTVRKNFIAANVMILAAILSFLFLRNTILILIFMFVLGFSQIPQPSILDTWILKKLPGKEEEYGHIRLWASIGFAVSALVYGLLIRRFGFHIMFLSAAFFIVLTLLTSLRLEDTTGGALVEGGLKKSFKALFTNRKYLFFLSVCFIIGLAYRTVHLLLPLLVTQVGGTSWDLGMAYFFGVITEIPMLLLSKRLSKKIKPYLLILISAILFAVQLTLLLLAKSPLLVLAAQAAQGLAFGNYLPSMRLFVYENAPESLRTSAQTFADAVCSSLSGVLGSAVGGVILQNRGTGAVLMIGIGLLALAAVILTVKILKGRRRHFR